MPTMAAAHRLPRLTVKHKLPRMGLVATVVLLLAAAGALGPPKAAIPRRRVISSLGILGTSWSTAAAGLALAQEGAVPAAAGNASTEPQECRGGAILGESQVPGAYRQVCMELPERRVPLRSSGGAPLVIRQGGTGASAGSLAGRTGVAVWNSALLMTRLLDEIAAGEARASVPPEASLLRGGAVVELGCGTGLASLAAARLGAASVLATDGNGEVVALAASNAERNGLADRVTAKQLQWGLMDAAEYYDEADLILGADLTYNSGTWRALAETMGAVLKPTGYVLYLTTGHSGFNVQGELGGFLSVVGGEGLELIDEASDRWPLRGGASSMTQLLGSCLSPEEKKGLEGNGGASAIVLGKKQPRNQY